MNKDTTRTKRTNRVRNLVADGIGVDAGIIMVGCMSYLDTVDQRKDGMKLKLGQVFNVKNGDYKIRWKIRNTWNGSVQGTKKIKITSGKLFVCDPCYIIGSDEKGKVSWCEWLHAEYFNPEDFNGKNVFKSDKAFCIDSMGGDGEYVVEMELTYE